MQPKSQMAVSLNNNRRQITVIHSRPKSTIETQRHSKKKRRTHPHTNKLLQHKKHSKIGLNSKKTHEQTLRSKALWSSTLKLSLKNLDRTPSPIHKNQSQHNKTSLTKRRCLPKSRRSAFLPLRIRKRASLRRTTTLLLGRIHSAI